MVVFRDLIVRAMSEGQYSTVQRKRESDLKMYLDSNPLIRSSKNPMHSTYCKHTFHHVVVRCQRIFHVPHPAASKMKWLKTLTKTKNWTYLHPTEKAPRLLTFTPHPTVALLSFLSSERKFLKKNSSILALVVKFTHTSKQRIPITSTSSSSPLSLFLPRSSFTWQKEFVTTLWIKNYYNKGNKNDISTTAWSLIFE